jgi:hypothetical protein
MRSIRTRRAGLASEASKPFARLAQPFARLAQAFARLARTEAVRADRLRHTDDEAVRVPKTICVKTVVLVSISPYIP